MKMNLMTDYAIRTIKLMATNENEVLTSNYISEKEEIPHGVLMKVLRCLRTNNIVVSHQGRGELVGGYSLCLPINELTILHIVEIMEGPIQLNFSPRKKASGQDLSTLENMETSYKDVIELEYLRILEIIRQEMSRYSMSELLQQERSGQ